jgi:hypothetical protein
MVRPRLAKKPRHLQASIGAEDEAFLLSLGLPISSAFRALIATVRTHGRHLPVPVARRLEEDAKALGLGPLEYIRLALHQRYRQFAAGDVRPAKTRRRR